MFWQKRSNVKKTAFVQSEKGSRAVLWKELEEKYNTEMPLEEAKALAVLVVSYLNGNDLDELCGTTPGNIKSHINKVRHLAETKAKTLMQESAEVRELIVRTNAVRIDLFGDSLKSIYRENSQKIVTNFLNEFQKAADFDLYAKVAERFCNKVL